MQREIIRFHEQTVRHPKYVHTFLFSQENEDSNSIKEEDLKTLDNDELELLDFALDHEEEGNDRNWSETKPKPIPAVDTVKKIEKPRQCEKVN